MSTLGQLLLVAIGGAFGAAARHAVNLMLARGNWPWSTLIVNVLGCILLGIFVHWFTMRDFGWWQQSGRLLLATGFCGAFTTMSALALETSELARVSGSGVAAGFAVGTLVLSIAGLFVGVWLARSVF